MNIRRSSLVIAITSCLALSTTTAWAEGICDGIEAQVRIAAGETFVSEYQGKGTAPYVPATPYGYVGYKMRSGISFGLGLGFLYFKLDNNVGPQIVNNSGWALMVAPTFQVPVFRPSENIEIFGVARFILGAGSQTLQSAAAPVSTSIPFMTYGGNIGAGGTWYPTSRFGIGAEAGAAVNAYNSKATTTTASVAGSEAAINALYVQTYFALTASYIF